MPETIDRNVPNCLNVPKKRWGWHWKQFERARFPSYNRNRSLFGRMLNRIYDIGVKGFRQALTFDSGLKRAEFAMKRQAPPIVESTYRTAYENTAKEFARGFDRNLNQKQNPFAELFVGEEPDEDEDQDVATLALLAVRDFFTARLFQQQRQRTLAEQVSEIVSTHSQIAKTVLTEQARAVVGTAPGEPLPNMSPEQLNQIALSARRRFKNQITPKHSKAFSTTETVAASNLGTLAVARARQQTSGQVLTKYWLSQRDARVRDSHVNADSQNIGLDSLFLVGRSLLAFPGDWSHGAELKEIINCRCVLIYFSQN